jgi:hypothetical protein
MLHEKSLIVFGALALRNFFARFLEGNLAWTKKSGGENESSSRVELGVVTAKEIAIVTER